jgi:transcriptional regulator with XRE-family HTH domain
MSNLAHNLRALRKARGLGLRELARLVGVSASTLSRAEGGRFETVRFSTIQALSRFFGMSIDDLLGKHLCCMDCGMSYLDFGLDVALPDEQWALVSGRDDGSGILCAACIVKRAAKLPGITVARMRLE